MIKGINEMKKHYIDLPTTVYHALVLNCPSFHMSADSLKIDNLQTIQVVLDQRPTC